MEQRWYDSLLLIADFIPPNPDEMDVFDVEGQVRTIRELGFNSQHIEVTDITVGEAGITFFDSTHAVQKRKDLLGLYKESYGKYGGNDLIYFNVHWLNESLILLHPEWFQLYAGGEIIPIGYGSGGYSCVNSPFRDWAFSIIKDIGKYGVKGIFLDGPVFNGDGCYCEGCLSRFEKEYGFRYTPESMKDIQIYKKVLRFKHDSIAEFVRDARTALKSVNEYAVIYINGLPLGPSTCGRDNRIAWEHQDALLAEGGFLSGDLREIPIWKPAASAKLLENQAEGKPAIIAIAGRQGGWSRYLLTAAETWLTYAMAVSNGAHIWYGIYDTNRKDARMKTVKEINRFLSTNSYYIADTVSTATIALVWSVENANMYQTTTEGWDFVKERTEAGSALKSDSRKAFNGWFEALQRSHCIFDVVDDFYVKNRDLSGYELVILPDVACMSEAETEKIKEYVKNGGHIITTYDTSCYDDSGIPAGKAQLGEVLGISGIEGTGTRPYDHIEVEDCIFTRGIDQPLIPSSGLFLKAVPCEGSKCFMHYREKQPSRYCDLPPEISYPFMILNGYGKGKALMFTGSIDASYDSYRFPEHLAMMRNAVEFLSTRQVFVDPAFTSLFVNMRRKDEAGILHLVNYTSYGGRAITDIIPFKDLHMSVRSEKKPSRVKALRSNRLLDFEYADGLVKFSLPEVKEYEIVIMD